MPDDDIMDLTEIVKPGQKTEAAATPDFGSDLDALLQDLDNGLTGKAAAPAAQAAPPDGPDLKSLGTKPADGHVVNPNEEIELPPLSDLDALLAELGVENPPKAPAKPAVVAPDFDELDAASDQTTAPQATIKPVPQAVMRPAPATPASGPAPVVAPNPAQAPSMQTAPGNAQAVPKQKPSTGPSAAQITADTDLEAIMAGMQDDLESAPAAAPAVVMPSAAPAPSTIPVAAAPKVQAAAPATPVDPFEAAQVASATPAPAATPTTPATAAPVGGIDLGELDAMLDKVLLAAPKRPVRDVAKTAGNAVNGDLANPVAQPVASAAAPVASATPVPSAAPVAPAAPVVTVSVEPDEDDDILELELSAVETPAPVQPVAAPADDILDLELSAVETTALVQPVAAPKPITPTVPADPFEAAQAAPVAPVAPAAPVLEQEPEASAPDAALPDLSASTASPLSSVAPVSQTSEVSGGELEALRSQVAELQAELALLRAGFEAMQTNLEKSAAQAAARVIREELATLAATL